ncbi:MAG: hypothetical protein A2289_03075 [Deltaproteobacteria bacterium RIFOXYA12_FULL_58_15]|nr:MAG: hypothetical protein A2289_03075 [Deltaproteobacteria bacterium RIFOXYA12_FULL_58_15]
MLQTQELDAITAAIASQRQYLLRVSGQSHEVISFIGPQSFGRLVDYRARVHQGLTENLRFSAQQRLYDRLPVPLQNLVDNRAMRQPVYRPDPDNGLVVHVAGGKDWFEHARNWDGSTKVVRSSRPCFQGGGSGPYGHLYPEVLLNMGWSDQRIAQLQQDRKDYRQVDSGQAVSLDERPERFLANPPPVVSVGKLMHGLLLRELHTIVDLYEPYVDKLPTFGEQSELSGVGVPNSIRAIWPRLRQIPGSAQRKKALPWLLLSYMVQAAGSGGRIRLEDLKKECFKGDPWARENLEGLYVEAAPDQSHERNVLRTQFAGELDNEVRRQLRQYAPELLRFVPTGKSIIPKTVSQILACTQEAPLANVNVIAVQHLLDDNVGLIESLRKFGVDPNCTHVLGVPYSTCEPDADVLRASGVDVDTRERRGLPYDAWRSVQVCNLIRKSLADHARNNKPIVVLDDGGYVTKALHKYFPEHANKFVIVEQTTRGLTVAKDLELKCDVINIAKSEAKMLELPGLEYRFKQQVRARLDPFAGDDFMPGKPAAILGYGWIGMTTARAMRELGRAVVVVEPDPIKRAQAERDGYRTVTSADQIIHEAAIIAGCTGKQSLTKEQLHSLRHGPVLFSASSSNVEFELPNDSRFHDDMLVQGDGYNYLVLGAGFPINFTGAGDINTPEELQYTRGAMLYGAIQGAASFAKRGADWKPQVVDLEETYDAHLLKMSETLGNGVSNRQEDEEESSKPFARFGRVGGRFGAWKR